MYDTHQTRLTEHAWGWITTRLPIACVDVLPVERDLDDRIVKVGLIRRHSPWGVIWCHLGGRLGYGESLLDGARRHVEQGIGLSGAAIDDQPFFVNQYFPRRVPGLGFDPRKHAVSVCYTARIDSADARLTSETEAVSFKWFDRRELPSPNEMWPGTDLMLEKLLDSGPPQHMLITYQTLTARCISHNELMWQTPVLAMTAMAFLLTIGLGDGANWARALAAALSMTVAIISLQLMTKHSSHQIADSDALSRVEAALNMAPVNRKPTRRLTQLRPTNLAEWLATQRSRQWWFWALGIFALVSLAVGVLAVLGI